MNDSASYFHDNVVLKKKNIMRFLARFNLGEATFYILLAYALFRMLRYMLSRPFVYL